MLIGAGPATSPTTGPTAAPTVKVTGTRFFVPPAELDKRAGADHAPLLAYIKALLAKVNEVTASAELGQPKGLFVAVGVKPDGTARAWCEGVGGTVPPATLDRLARELAGVPPIKVTGGPFAFSLDFAVNGRVPDAFPVMPAAWQHWTPPPGGGTAVPDDLFKVIWPDAASTTQPTTQP